jgi:hypothetical protein
MAPQVLATPRDLTHNHQRRNAVDEHQSSAPAYPPTESEAKLAKLEERLRHELMDDEGRQELWDRALALRRPLRDAA